MQALSKSKERIGLKTYNWIDSLLDSKCKRRILFMIVVLIYWLWQNIWQTVFYFQLYKISDYSTLFDFLENMNQYNQSVLVSILYEIVMTSTMPLSQICWNVCQQFHIFDIIILFFTVLLYKTSDKKTKWRVTFTLLICLVLVDVAFIAYGFKQGSLLDVISILNILSIVSMIVEMGILGIILESLIRFIEQFMKYNFVHNS